MANATSRVCVECGTPVVLNGKSWPQRCPPCRERHRLAEGRRRASAWRLANLERARDTTRRYEAAHPDAGRKRAKAWYHANKERAKAQPSQQPEVRKVYNAAYYAANREREIQRVLEYARSRGRDAKRAADAFRRAVRRGSPDAPAERFTLDEIYERDAALCQLCGLPVDRTVATMDHIIPITKGGPHTRANVQLAHRSCNTRKSNRL